MKMKMERPPIWIAFRTGMVEGYVDMVGPFEDGEMAMDFAEARGKEWDCTIMTYPDEWKPLFYPWEIRR